MSLSAYAAALDTTGEEVTRRALCWFDPNKRGTGFVLSFGFNLYLTKTVTAPVSVGVFLRDDPACRPIVTTQLSNNGNVALYQEGESIRVEALVWNWSAEPDPPPAPKPVLTRYDPDWSR